MPSINDLTGKIFGELTVIKQDENVGGHSGWLCQCSCGNATIVASNKLTIGHTASCGHLKRDVNHTGLRKGYQDKKQNGVAVFLLDSNRKIRTDNVTGFTGVKPVTYRNGSIHYAAEISIKGKRTRIGTFNTIQEAAAAREKVADKLLNNLNDQ
ncbi:hypothetical protein [Dellaglioa algida]|uniref:hypothetical protein n=1 Tax=Dellaglioa algida TaxID=105612 RepID=UPI0024C47BA5|nr:hypothetical protein [Dellaglioa algida]MDK1716647.1 hypothetical protein [Dellaglioa algida]MDK1721589.1 hypothetical protein [Dellaglioa algida]